MKNKVVSNRINQQPASVQALAVNHLSIALIREIVCARKEKGLTQKDIEKASGVKQPVIARLEHGVTDPQLSAMLKVLASLGKTLAIVPLSGER